MNYIPYIEDIQNYSDLTALDIIISKFNPLITEIMNSKGIVNKADCHDKVVSAILKKTLEFDTKNIKCEDNS